MRQSLTESFSYDNLHRLTGATGPDAFTVGYDPRGNITARTGNVGPGATHTMTWYSYNLPNTISASGNQSSQFFYAPDRARWKQAASYGGTGEETIYIGGLIEKVTLGTVTSWKHYIAGASGTIAVYTRKSNGTNELHYLTRDHLGSVDSVTSAAGAAELRLSFSALGQRRNEDTWSGNPTSGDWSGITNTTRRGFTSHEMLDNLNLTHMNGRVYDQVIGQFASADPFIDGAGSTQGWNRFGYLRGNPLNAWDPTGYKRGTQIYAWQNGPDSPPPSERHGDMIRFNDVGLFWENARAGVGGIIGGGPAWHPRPDLWQLSRGWGSGEPLVGTPDDTPSGPRASPGTLFPNGTPVRGPGDTVSTVNWTKVRDSAFFLWDDYEGFKSAVRLIWEGDMPGNGSLEANLAALPFIPAVAVEGAGARLALVAGGATQSGNFIRGMTVLGRYPGYIENAQSAGASFFSLSKLGNLLPRSLVWQLNKRFLDRAVARGDQIVLARPFNPVNDAGTWLADEIAYLSSRYGYILSDGITMVPP